MLDGGLVKAQRAIMLDINLSPIFLSRLAGVSHPERRDVVASPGHPQSIQDVKTSTRSTHIVSER